MSKTSSHTEPPIHVSSTFRRALELHRSGRIREAERLYASVLAAEPNHVDALNNRGSALRELKQYKEALVAYAKALKLRPDSAETLYNYGNALQDLGRHEEALERYDEALDINPDLAGAWLNRGNALRELARYDDALKSYDRALLISPQLAGAWNSRGVALQRLGRDEEALADYERALAIEPRLVEALSNRGYALRQLGRYQEALASYAAAVQAKPDYADAHWNESIARLCLGDFKLGWRKYEWRWRTAEFKWRDFGKPQWMGQEPIGGRRIFLHAEQGLGDTIQFVRYAPLLVKEGASVIVEVQPALVPLLSAMPGLTVIGRGDPIPDFDFHCPLMSLPLAFGTEIATIPARVPYLFVAEERVAEWKRRVLSDATARVGLAWAGRREHKNDRQRSIALSAFAPLLAIEEVSFVSLQRDVSDEDRAAMAEHPNLVHPGQDLLDTAAIMGGLDLIITVDTVFAHLAGALALPVWILLPFAADFRWMTNREDSPWYPTARLLRQPQVGDWRSVIAKARRELQAFVRMKSF